MGRFVAIAEIVKAVGLKGEVKLYPLLDYFEPLLDSSYVVWGDGTDARVQRHRQAGSCEAVKLEGVDNRTTAERSAGCTPGTGTCEANALGLSSVSPADHPGQGQDTVEGRRYEHSCSGIVDRRNTAASDTVEC